MSDPRTAKLAETLVNYCVAVQPGDWVLVRGHVLALPLVEQVVQQVTRAGGNPTVQLTSDELDEFFLREANETQLAWASPLEELMAERLDVRIHISAASNTRALTGIAPYKQQLYQKARRPFSQRYLQRSAEGTHRWVLTSYPCPAYAQDADMSLADYADFVYAATYADQPDPVQCWRAIHNRQVSIQPPGHLTGTFRGAVHLQTISEPSQYNKCRSSLMQPE
jgi:aminopeptidase